MIIIPRLFRAQFKFQVSVLSIYPAGVQHDPNWEVESKKEELSSILLLRQYAGDNLYANVDNDLLNLADPSGEFVEVSQMAARPYIGVFRIFVVAPLYNVANAVANSPMGEPGLYASVQGLGPPGEIIGRAGATAAHNIRWVAGCIELLLQGGYITIV